ncbi:hypothetical protein OBBRIDRAFT_429017 [Obba rivulosa]|uniref:Uncharacterized protein n=1 Tax=Obba rivulosa TaxID=1052685 RepID=A0A8E2DMT1_9APHY|nr:hypothetical protein OBBRIDRAFT_429017 [Obba rivulosa]
MVSDPEVPPAHFKLPYLTNLNSISVTPARVYQSRSKSKTTDRQMEEKVVQFCGITGASTSNARRFIEKYRGLEAALNAYYNDPNALLAPQRTQGASTSKVNDLFNKYKGSSRVMIAISPLSHNCVAIQTQTATISERTGRSNSVRTWA